MLTEDQQQKLKNAQGRIGNFYLCTQEQEYEKPTLYKVNEVFHGLFLAANIIEYDLEGKRLGVLEVPIRHLENDPEAPEDLITRVEAQERVGQYSLWRHPSWLGQIAFYQITFVGDAIEGLTAQFLAYDEEGNEIGDMNFPYKNLQNDPLAPENLVAKVKETA